MGRGWLLGQSGELGPGTERSAGETGPGTGEQGSLSGL
jgi:hypothetical protein